jgi:6-carboxyhexanoate--CoA ligase
MRSSCQGRHISGAERMVNPAAIDDVVRELVARARGRSPAPDQISVSIEDLGEHPVRALKALDLVTLGIPDVISGRAAAARVLQSAGVSVHAAESAIRLLSRGASPSGGTMRGAIIMDALTGERLEHHRERGVRASRFDWDELCGTVMRQRLSELGLSHFRTFEALALATKVAHAPGSVAELCWSDEPDYTAGYVASLQTGYVRLPALKAAGDPKGGRVFFVNVNYVDMDLLVRYLQEEPVLIRSAGKCRAVSSADEYFTIIGQNW